MYRKIKVLACLFIVMITCVSSVYGYTYNNDHEYVEQEIRTKLNGTPLDNYNSQTNIEMNSIVLKLKDINSIEKLQISEEISSKYDNTDTVTIEIPEGSDPDKIITKYKEDAGVEEAYVDQTVNLFHTPIDPYYDMYQWNLQRIKMESAWDVSQGDPSVIIAVIDTGYGPFPDVDGFVNGVDISGSTILEDTYPGQYSYEGSMHGTAVTSLISSNMNSIGIAGIVPNVAIMPVKVFPNGKSQTGATQIAAGIRWAADHEVDFINVSVGSFDGTYAMEEAVNYAISKGVMIIAASGNEANRDHVSYPAAYDGVIAVGSTGRYDGVSSFSNEGSALDIVAPGEDIFLASYPYSYGLLRGTSFSSPTVCAIAALVKSAYPSYSNDLITTILYTGTDDILQSGWDKSSGHGIINAQKVMSIAANHSILDVIVNFETQGATTIDSWQVPKNTTIIPPTDPIYDGYKFGGWYKEATNTNAWDFATDKVTENTTLYAKWTANDYTVSFNTQSGSNVISKIAKYNTLITQPTNPTRTGYGFSSWYKEATCVNPWTFATDKVTSDTTLYAKWTANDYMIIFNTQGGSNVISETAQYNTLISQPTNPTYTGYGYRGWYKEATCINPWNFATDKVSGGTTLYAKWTANDNTIGFNTKNGSNIKNKTANTLITHPTNPTRTGYEFSDWYEEAIFKKPRNFTTAKVKDSINSYAKATVANYTVSFNSQGGSKITSIIAKYNTLITQPTNPTRTLHELGSWCNEGSRKNPWNFTTAKATGNTPLYAKWNMINYLVRFNWQGDSNVISKVVKYNTLITQPTNLNRTRYVFDGWYKEATYINPWNFTTDKVTSSTTLYAKWIVVSYTVSFNSRDRSNVTSKTIENNTLIRQQMNSTRTGYAKFPTAVTGFAEK